MGNKPSKKREGSSVYEESYDYTPLEAKAFQTIYQKHRMMNGNRPLRVITYNPVTDTMQRAYFQNFSDGNKQEIRWGHYFMEESRLKTTELVTSVSAAPEPFNPFLSAVQTVAFPIPMYSIKQEIDLFDSSQGMWQRAIVIAIEKLYYVLKQIDHEKCRMLLSKYQEEVNNPTVQQARTVKLNEMSRKQRLRFLDQEQKQKEQKLFEIRLACTDSMSDPIYVRRNSGRQRAVYAPDSFFRRMGDHFTEGETGSIFDIGRLLMAGRALDLFSGGLFIRVKEDTTSGWIDAVIKENGSVNVLDSIEAEMNRINERKTFYGMGDGDNMNNNKFANDQSDDDDDDEEEEDEDYDNDEEVARVDESSRLTSQFRNGFFDNDSKQREWCDQHVQGWSNGGQILDTHLTIRWQRQLELRNGMKVMNPTGAAILGQTMYQSISHQLFGSSDNWQYIRLVCQNHLAAHPNYFKHFVDIDYNFYLQLRQLAIEDEDAIALPDLLDLQAVCEVFDVCVEVYSPMLLKIGKIDTIEPSMKFYADINEDRTRERYIPTMKLAYNGDNDWSSVWHKDQQLPLKVHGNIAMGQKAYHNDVIMQARMSLSSVPQALNLVQYCGFLKLDLLGSEQDHMRAIFVQTPFSFLNDPAQIHTYKCTGLKVTTGDDALTIMDRIGALKHIQVKRENGSIMKMSYAGDMDLGDDAYRINFILEGHESQVKILLAAMKVYANDNYKAYLIKTTHVSKDAVVE